MAWLPVIAFGVGLEFTPLEFETKSILTLFFTIWIRIYSVGV